MAGRGEQNNEEAPPVYQEVPPTPASPPPPPPSAPATTKNEEEEKQEGHNRDEVFSMGLFLGLAVGAMLMWALSYDPVAARRPVCPPYPDASQASVQAPRVYYDARGHRIAVPIYDDSVHVPDHKRSVQAGHEVSRGVANDHHAAPRDSKKTYLWKCGIWESNDVLSPSGASPGPFEIESDLFDVVTNGTEPYDTSIYGYTSE